MEDALPTGQSDSAPLRGCVVFFFAFDLAYELRREELQTVLGERPEVVVHASAKRSPISQTIYQPLMVRLPETPIDGPCGRTPLEISIMVLPIGAAGFTAKVPFAVENVEALGAFCAPAFAVDLVRREVLALAEKLRTELQPHAVRLHPQLGAPETFTVFCLEAAEGAQVLPGAESAEAWFHENRPAIARLLTQEAAAENLSDQEAQESTSRWLSYYRTDLAVIDWDAALLVDRPADFGETLHVLELANLQLEELEAYDRFLDEALERAYRDIGGQRPARQRRAIMADLREIRIDLARFSDELSNITKFFGDWHLARIYETAASRFHLADWHRAIDEKLKTLQDLYEILKNDQNTRFMLWLEMAVVLLFIIDLLLLFAGLAK